MYGCRLHTPQETKSVHNEHATRRTEPIGILSLAKFKLSHLQKYVLPLTESVKVAWPCPSQERRQRLVQGEAAQ